jgi:AAA family ATP:ADP antiporter
MVAIKSLSYALNNPCKEIMYLPTSKDIKFKAKGWIDGFGGRSAKAVPVPSNQRLIWWSHGEPYILRLHVISLGIVGFWILVALYVGRTNKKLSDSGQILS